MTPSTPNEYQVRIEKIDPMLRVAGWEVDTRELTYARGCRPEQGKCKAISEWPVLNPDFPDMPYSADYILFDGLVPIGTVEAKKESVSAQNVLVQAQRYSKGFNHESPFNYHGYKIPFLYSCNGNQIWFQDIRPVHSRSREISAFHTGSALQEKLGRDFEAACQWFKNNKPLSKDEGGFLYPYQVEANEAIEKAITNNQRKMLVAMATGTGKTFTVISECYRLIKSGMAKRILFLVDRRALAAQTVSSFSAFEAQPGYKFHQLYPVYSQRFKKEDLDEDEDMKFEPQVLPNDYLTDPQAKHTFVYVSTIQRMAINLLGPQSGFELGDDEDEDLADAEPIDIPIHAFDIIIADECHRGYTAKEMSKWRMVLNYFDAVKIGLTATPAAHTVAYFSDEIGKSNIIYRYDYERAVNEGWLVDYEEVHVHSDARINGVFLNEGERIEWVDVDKGTRQLDLLEAERAYDASEVERKITAPDSNRKIIEELKKYTDQHEKDYGRFPKILIFAANDHGHTSHADTIVNICRDVFGQGDSFVQKITGNPNVDKPLQLIRKFRNQAEPKIVVTVDMLSTGVDVKPIEFIVMMRPVQSRILWEQMLGRGTRLCKDLLPQKDHFKVFDCFGGTLFNYFRDASNITAEAPEKSSRSLEEVINDIYQNRERDYNIKCLVKRLRRKAKALSGEAIEKFAEFIPDGDLGAFAEALPKLLAEDFAGIMKLLRNEDFIELIKHPPQVARTFLVAHDFVDTVSSAVLPGGMRPEDYLTAFSRFIEDNQDQVDALKILLKRPEGWNTNALTELRKALQSAPERFNEKNLRTAYHKDLADIISMVKYAAKQERQLLTASERVEKALNRIKADTPLDEKQLIWLDLIAQHLVTQLSVEPEDFEAMPLFFNKGGLGKAKRVFGNMFENLLKRINKEIAA